MRFFGLSPTEFSLLFATAAFLAVVFYLLSFRRRTAVMAAEPIWRRVLGRRRTPFRKLLALLLQILILFLLALALADPRIEREDPAPPVAVAVVVDTSASMSAIEGDRQRIDVARTLVERMAAALGPRDRMLLLAMDDRCRPLARWTADAGILRRAAAGLAAGAMPEDFESAVAFAASALRARPTGDRLQRRLVVIGDRFHSVPAGDLPGELLQVRVGRTRANLALTAFDIRRRSGAARGHEVFVEVTNTGRRDRRATLSLHTAETLLGAEDISVPGRDSWARSYFLEPVAADRLMATLTGRGGRSRVDRLALDDRAFALLPERQQRRVLLVTPGNLFLEKVLALDPTLSLEVIAPEAFGPGRLATVQAAVFDRFCPPSAKPAIYFAPPEQPGCPFGLGEAVTEPDLLPLRGDHPVTEQITLVDMRIGQARRLLPEPGDAELLADSGGPLVIARQAQDRKRVAFGFDLMRSDLPLRVAFPMLMHNCLVWFLGEQVDMGTAEHAVGGWSRLPDWVDADTRIVAPDGHRVGALALGGRWLLKLRQPGFYTIEGADQREVLPANFLQPSESSLPGGGPSGPGRLDWAPDAPLPQALHAGFDKEIPPEPPLQWPVILLAVAWLLLFDWVFFCFRILF